MNSNGKLPHDQARPPMEPMPQSGLHAIEKLCLWFERDRESVLKALDELGVPVELGIAHRGLHHFRHTAATTLIEQGISITDVSGALGHSKPFFTMHAYVHNRKQKHGKAFGALTAVECDKKADRQPEGGLRDSETVDTVGPRETARTTKSRKPVQRVAKTDLQMQKKESGQ